jgi:hypothetical protein
MRQRHGMATHFRLAHLGVDDHSGGAARGDRHYLLSLSLCGDSLNPILDRSGAILMCRKRHILAIFLASKQQWLAKLQGADQSSAA